MQLRLIDLFCGWTASFRLSDKANERIWLLFCYLGMKHRQRAKHHVPTWTISSSAFKWRVAAWWLLYEVASYFWPLWGLNTVMYRNDVWLVVVYFCWTGIVWCLLRFSEVLFLLIDFSQSRFCYEQKQPCINWKCIFTKISSGYDLWNAICNPFCFCNVTYF